MPIKVAPYLSAWSYSRLSDYEECPLKAKCKHLDKIAEPGGEALERGKRIHTLAEQYTMRRLTELPPELANFPEEFGGLRARKDVECERQLAVNRNWQPCGWFGADAWLRIVVDVTYAGATPDEPGRVVVDHKTGKIRVENASQLDLYGLVMFAYYPGIKRVDSALWYLDQGEIVSKSLVPDEAPALRAKWEQRVAPMLADRTFAPTPGNGCRWCFYGQSGKAKRGPGLCQF